MISGLPCILGEGKAQDEDTLAAMQDLVTKQNILDPLRYGAMEWMCWPSQMLAGS